MFLQSLLKDVGGVQGIELPSLVDVLWSAQCTTMFILEYLEQAYFRLVCFEL
jgi:hypothetical protein